MLTPTQRIWHNGRFIPWEQATIHVLSHVVSYGSSVFEGIRCYATPAGPAIFRLCDHVRRLADSAKIYRMDLGYTREELADAASAYRRLRVRNIQRRPLHVNGYIQNRRRFAVVES